MRQDDAFFGEQELVLVYVGKKLREALRAERTLTAAGIDYFVETDEFAAGVIFKRKRIGAFMYVTEGDEARAKELLTREGFALPQVVKPGIS
jgi:hypothetical protein